jgi:hypothetical protein
VSLANYQSLVPDAVRDKDSAITTTQRDTAIQTAVLRYSKDRPRSLVVDVTSAGGYRLPLPLGFTVDFSKLQSIEQPIGDVPEHYLDMARVTLYRGPSTTEIQLPTSLQAGDVARVCFTARHVLDVATDTILDDDRNAVVSYAAALLCDQLSNFYATSIEASIGADAVNHASKTESFASRARFLRGQYFKDLGIDEKRQVAASATADLNLPASHGGARLFPRAVRVR